MRRSIVQKRLLKNTMGKMSLNMFIVPLEKSKEIISFLDGEKVHYSLFEFWSDDI